MQCCDGATGILAVATDEQLERFEHLPYGRAIGKRMGRTVNRNFQHPGKQRVATKGQPGPRSRLSSKAK